MADILIKGMDMPKDTGSITVTIYSDGSTGIWTEQEMIAGGMAVALPEHGRLISDRDVKALLRSGLSLDTDADIDHVCGMIDGLPTILEATE